MTSVADRILTNGLHAAFLIGQWDASSMRPQPMGRRGSGREVLVWRLSGHVSAAVARELLYRDRRDEVTGAAMVGVLAVSAPLEEYNVQPCKKRQKDEDPQSKTITNYFSPLSKAIDKGLSSPKSSSIADYFIKTPPAANREHTLSTKTTSPRGLRREASSTPLTPSSKHVGRAAKLGKRTRLLKRLGDTVLPPDRSNGGGNSASSGIMGSDTAALLAEICSHTADLGGEEEDDDVVFQSETFITGSPTTPPRGQTLEHTASAESVNVEPPSTEPSDRRPPLISSVSSGDKTSLGDTSLEGQVNTSDNLGTLTISFEDFMRSQGSKLESTSAGDTSDVTSAVEEDLEAGLMASPKTVTIQAQVHLSPPLQSHNSTKIASIFKKSKVEKKKPEEPAPEYEKIGPVVSKRKSNVVIHEEDLELAVIDVEAGEATKPKSTPAERQQFMKAFQQAGEAKAKTKKHPTKKKDLKEGMEDHHKEAEEQQAPDKAAGVENAEETDKGTKLKRKKTPSGEIPKPAEKPSDKDETDKGMKLKRKKTPSGEIPKPAEKPPDKGETDKGTKLKRKTMPSIETPKPAENPCDKDETDKGTKLKRKKTPSGEIPKPAEKPPDKDETDKGTKLKRKKTPSGEIPKPAEKPRDKGEETDKGTKQKRKTTQQPSVETPKSSKPEEEQQPTPPHNSPVLRRSLRRPRSSPSRSPPRMAADSPVFMSTPKINTLCEKTDVYRSEVLTETSEVESPIRMRFTRVTRSNRRGQRDPEDEASSPGSQKVFQSAKKLSKAKQLLEKAKAIRQNMAKAEAPVRRVTRQRSHGTQDPVVIADDASCQKDVQKTATLRSLNDVLGKNAKKKGVIHSGHKKDAKEDKVGVITIDDSPEVSENSQDEEQCKARREFLKSGLPDSLKRQIAKTSAIMEAYSVSGSSFQTAIHVQQRDGGTMWSLAMPRCRLLTDLSPLCCHVPDISRLALSLGDFTRVTSASAVQPFPPVVLKRPVFSNIIRDFLLEEIRWHNPQFPVRRFFKQFLKKQSDYISLQDPSRSETPQTEKCLGPAADNSSVQETGSGAKRKRKDSPHTKSKRRKQADEEPQCDSAPNPQLSRPSRRKRSTPAEPDVILIKEEDEDLKATAEDDACEDVLWTEKYQPQNSSELIGNSVAVQRLHSWLREWKIRAEKEEKRNQLQKSGKDKDDTWSAGDFHDSEDSDEDSLCNTLLISGPPGVGKTAAVYACAQELGFKVFEVNASCQRSGRQILAQLKEATQSHQVDQQGVSAHKPCFFSSNSTRSPRKLLNSPKRVVSSPRKPPVSPRGQGIKRGLAPKSLTNFFFKAAPKQKPEVKRTADPVRAPQSGSDVKTSDGKTSRPLLSVTGSAESQRKTATSLILFEEVDIIFDDDTGFLGAVKTFMSTTKRPVILTTSDPTFRMIFDGAFEEISFHSPSVVNVTSFLQVLCLAENLRTDPKDLMTFVTGNRGDIRRSVLHLQFWARSGGGLLKKPLLPPDKPEMEASDGAFCKDPEIRSAEVPGCSVGCAENLLGVNSIIPPNDSLVSFVKEKILEPAEWDRILQLSSEFHCRNVSFTSSNLEFLLPLPVHIEESVAPVEIVEPAPEEDDGLMEDTNVKLSAAMKRRRKLVLLNDSDLFESDSNSVDEVVSVSAEGPEEEQVREVRRVRRALSSAERQASLLVCRCLDSMAEFADHMSFLDCATCDPADPAHSPAWTESRLKDGLCDGLRTEGRDWWSAQSCGDIRGHIEALSLHKCSSKISTTLSSLELCKLSGKDPSEELTLRVTAARKQVHFGEPAASVDIAQSRLSVVRDVMSHRAFTGLGNRDVNVTEYLPALRTICRLQKEREKGKTKRRFLHYLEGIHLELSKATLDKLAADFP